MPKHGSAPPARDAAEISSQTFLGLQHRARRTTNRKMNAHPGHVRLPTSILRPLENGLECFSAAVVFDDSVSAGKQTSDRVEEISLHLRLCARNPFSPKVRTNSQVQFVALQTEVKVEVEPGLFWDFERDFRPNGLVVEHHAELGKLDLNCLERGADSFSSDRAFRSSLAVGRD